MGKRTRTPPVYGNIFDYLEENYEVVSSDTPLAHFYLEEIYQKQSEEMDGPVSQEKQGFASPEEAAALIREFAGKAGAGLIGFTEVKEHFLFQGVDVSQDFAVVIGVEMDFALIDTAPEPPSGLEVLRAYWTLGGVANKVAGFIRFLGYAARAHHFRSYVNYPPTILHTVAALEAGLGEIGRHGLLITEELGPRVRLATITTELPLPQGERKVFGVDAYCSSCPLCREACQGDAIPDEKTEERGFFKYTIDPYKCLPYFAKYDGCNLCVSKCAFNKKGEELKEFIKGL